MLRIYHFTCVSYRFKSNLLVKRFFFLLNTAFAIVIIDLISHVHHFLLRLWVRIPPGAWMSACFECFVLSGRGLCDALITRPEESYRMCCVVVCDLETSRMRRPWPALGRSATKRKSTSLYVRLPK